jgi:hypothetical protein
MQNMRNSVNSHFDYRSFQSHGETINGQLRVKEKEVNIKNGQGTKVVRFRGPRGGTTAKVEKRLTQNEVKNILSHNFIPNLFEPCINGCERRLRLNNSKTRRRNN